MLTDLLTERPWSAVLAPLGVETRDGRLLARDFTISSNPLATLHLEEPRRPHGLRVIGRVGQVFIRDGLVVANGYVLTGYPIGDEAAGRMASGVLRPEMDLAPFDCTHSPDGCLFTSGTLRALWAGTQAAWDEARFTLL